MMDKKIERPKVLLFYREELLANLVHGFLMEELTVCADLGIELRQIPNPHHFGPGEPDPGYGLMVSEYFWSFTSSRERCLDAARDFIKGITVGLEHSQKLRKIKRLR